MTESWKRHHPGWRHVLWTDEDNRRLVAERCPWFLETYDSFPKDIMRADTARYVYMYAFGGVYADLDMECLRPLDDGPLLASTSEGPNAANATDSRPPPAHLAAPKRSSAAPIGARSEVAVVALMGDDLAFGHNVPNAFLASAPGHPFWIEVLMTVQAAAAARREGDWVEIITGPVVLKAAAARYLRGAPPLHGPSPAPAADGAASAAAPSRRFGPGSPSARGAGGNGRGPEQAAGGSATDEGPLQAIKQEASAPLGPTIAVPLPAPFPPAGAGLVAGSGGGGGREPALAVLPARLIYPYDWHEGRPDFGRPSTAALRRVHRACSGWENGGFDAERCKHLVARRGAYTITYWTHSWAQRPRPWLLTHLPHLAAGAAVAAAAAAAAALRRGRWRRAVAAARRVWRLRRAPSPR